MGLLESNDLATSTVFCFVFWQFSYLILKLLHLTKKLPLFTQEALTNTKTVLRAHLRVHLPTECTLGWGVESPPKGLSMASEPDLALQSTPSFPGETDAVL